MTSEQSGQSELVERLRYQATPDQYGVRGPHADLCADAASRISALEDCVRELRDELAAVRAAVVASLTPSEGSDK